MNDFVARGGIEKLNQFRYRSQLSCSEHRNPVTSGKILTDWQEPAAHICQVVPLTLCSKRWLYLQIRLPFRGTSRQISWSLRPLTRTYPRIIKLLCKVRFRGTLFVPKKNCYGIFFIKQIAATCRQQGQGQRLPRWLSRTIIEHFVESLSNRLSKSLT